MPLVKELSNSKSKSSLKAGPKVSIIVLNWNGYEVTKDCLTSISKVDYPNYEVVLVDNGSTDGSAEKLAREYPWITTICNDRNCGFTGGNNIGMRRALEGGTEYVLLLNNDTTVKPDFLSKLIEVAEADDCIAILNPKIYYFDQPKRIWYAGGSFSMWKGLASHRGHRQLDKALFDTTREVSFITGCAFLIKAPILHRVGLLDDQLFYTYEDTDWSIRVRRLGYKAVYVPDAVIWHKESYDTKRNAGKAFRDYYNVRNSILIARKHARAYHWPSFLICLALLLGYRTAGYSLRAERDRVRALYKGLRDGFATQLAEESR